MLERELARLLGAEVVRRHRPRIADHADARQRGKLERGEVRMPEPALVPASAASRERREIEPAKQPRPAVAATNRHGDIDVIAHRHPRDRSKALLVVAGEALMAHPARLILDDAVSALQQQPCRAVDCRLVDDHPRGRVETEVEPAHQDAACRRVAKNSDTSAPHSPAARPRRRSRDDSIVARRTGRRPSRRHRSSASRAPNTTRAIRACMIAPAHMTQGSIVT